MNASGGCATAALAVAALLTACGAPPRPANRVTSGPRATPATTGPLRWVAEAAARAVALGASSPTLIATGAGAPGDSLGGRIHVPKDACGLVLVGGSPSLGDLDVFVYADDGTVLASDETVGRSPAALVCPPHGEHLYAFGRAAAGHGLFSVSLQVVAPAAAERAAVAAGGRGALTEHGLAEDAWPGLDEAVRHHREGAGGSPTGAAPNPDAWREVRRVAVPLDPRVPTQVAAPLEAGTCIDALAVPADDVAFVELSVLDGEGRVLARSTDGSETPSLLVCAATQTSVTLALRPRAGRGFAALVISATRALSADFRGRRAVEVDTGKTLPLAEARRVHGTEATAQGFGTGRQLLILETRSGERARVEIPLPGGCTRVDLVAGAPVAGLFASLWTDAGALLAEGQGRRVVTLFPCAPRQTAHLALDVDVAPGPVAVELRALPLEAPALTEEPLAASRLLGEVGRTRSLTELSALTPHKVRLTPDALAVEELTLLPASCVTAVIASGPGIEGVELSAVRTSDGASVGLARGTVSAELLLCAGADGPSRIRAELRSRAGTGSGLFEVLHRAAAPASR